ncbi:phage head spike fiber domain-containing protein [Escherichia coli]|uniref:phage head spike fiber domain-containing protein n=1 Tax=Escherichia coli TaxID=562 RepID=UPI001C16E816|nr:phage tail protein [Escherichia coli]MBV4815548.1 phage tail protein [Escherichia coli]MBV5057467.1 phage tail protein [Escherichia coli]MCG0109168.1 phage tail protein [Escherichia coli]HBD5699989.1 phage tail protein [Escherichia coli]HBD5770884.1 phage tail protein [Escherichia coli]
MIYTTGTIAVSGNTVTGTGTEFNAALSLIRVGCTLIAISNPVQIFSITEVKSATSLSVTPAASPSIPAGTKFSILLSDSISVDGLAQDVAETLRYYQGKESEIADAVEFFSDNKDVISASKLASESATTATNAATTATSAADSAKTYRDEAHEYANQTAQPYAYVLQPLPDVWMPFNDSLDMITGYSPGYKKVKIGDNVVQVASDKHVNFSRASTATYINKSGELKTAEINEPRFEKEGLLIEGQRTNYMLNSATPASWGKSANMNIAEVGTDSFGFTYGKFVCNESLIGQSTALNMAVVSTSGAVDVSGDNKCVTTSCRFKTDLELLLRIRFEAFDGSASSNLGYAIVNTRSLLVEITGVAADRLTARVNKDEAAGWIFVEATIQASEETYITSAIQYAPKSGGVVESGDYIYLATPQVENGPCASSFIISEATAATRASDMVTAPIKNNLYNLPFTVLCEVHKNWRKTPNAAPRVFETSGNQTGAAIILGFGRATEHDGFPYCDIGGSSPRVNENASLEKMVIGMRVKANQLTCAISNGRISSETKTTWTYIKSSATICIGGKTNTGERHLFGHVRNVRVWHKALTDTQLSEIV